MSKIPSYILARKPELKDKSRKSNPYKESIGAIIDWIVEVDDYFFNIDYQKFQHKSLSPENIESYKEYFQNKFWKDLQLKKDSFVIDLLSRCQRFNPQLTINDLISFLGLKSKPPRGRPLGKSNLTMDLDIGVAYYRRLRSILNAEYGIEAKEALLTKIATDWDINKEKLKQHLSKPKSRVGSIGWSVQGRQ